MGSSEGIGDQTGVNGPVFHLEEFSPVSVRDVEYKSGGAVETAQEKLLTSVGLV
jgi:hypothetical protein